MEERPSWLLDLPEVADTKRHCNDKLSQRLNRLNIKYNAGNIEQRHCIHLQRGYNFDRQSRYTKFACKLQHLLQSTISKYQDKSNYAWQFLSKSKQRYFASRTVQGDRVQNQQNNDQNRSAVYSPEREIPDPMYSSRRQK